MKIRFNRPVKTVSGRTLVGDDGKTPSTLGDVAVHALCNVALPGEDGEARYRRGKLARRIAQAKELDLEAEEIAQVKDAIGRYWRPDVVTPAFDMLEGRQG